MLEVVLKNCRCLMFNKIKLLIIPFIIFGALAFADSFSTPTAWKTSGSNVSLINSSNNVGIGTSATTVKLDIFGTNWPSAGTIKCTETANSGQRGCVQSFVGQSNGASDPIGDYKFFGNTTSEIADISVINGTTGASGLMNFKTSNGGADTTRMTIASNGNVGIGTTTTTGGTLTIAGPSSTSTSFIDLTTSSSSTSNTIGNAAASFVGGGQLNLGIRGPVIELGTSGTFTLVVASDKVGINNLTPSQMLDVVGTVKATSFQGYFPYVKASNTQSSGTSGGTATSGGWNTEIINTLDSDTQSIASLSSNDVTLPAGTYLAIATCPFFMATGNGQQCRLFNATDSSILLNGTSVFNSTLAGGDETLSVVTGMFTLSASKAVRLQYQVGTTRATDGLGLANSYGTEVFATEQFTKIQ